MKLLLVKALADSHVYSHYVRALAEALEALGHQPVVADLSAHMSEGRIEVGQLMRALADNPVDAVLSFSSFFGAAQTSEGRTLFDALGIKFAGWQLDHPIYAPQSLARGLRNRYAIYANANHTRFAEALKLPGRGLTMLPGVRPPDAPPKPYRARSRRIFVAAVCRGRPEPLWESLEDSPGKQLLLGVLEQLASDREASLLDAFNQTAQAMGLAAEFGVDPSFDDQIITLLREPLTYLRNLDRLNIVSALADSGLPLTIFGPGWRSLLGDRRNVTYVDAWIEFPEMRALYGDAQIVVNLNAGNGACERATEAAAAGAAVLSDDSGALAELFAGPAEIAFFNRARPAEAAEIAGRLLESDLGEAMAAQGHQRVLQQGLWRHRADQLIRYLETA